MSHLLRPRLHFRGEVRVNVSTCNNDDIAVAFPNQQFVDSASVTLNTLGMDDDAFFQWLRQQAPPFGIRAGWNLYGDCSCKFVDAAVHGAHPSDGDLLVDQSTDPIVGAAVELRNAVMVDLDPEGTLGTQIFCDEFSLNKTNDLRIVGRPTRMFSRLIARRNLAVRGFSAFAACWYAAIPPDQMTIAAGASPTLDSFRAAAAAGKGLYLAFGTYLLSPRISQQQLAQDFAIGLRTSNPAIGRVIGTLGIWNPDEMTSLPRSRKLVPGASLQHDHIPFTLNPAFALVNSQRRVISLDFMNTFPESDETLNKVNIGPVKLVLTSSQATGSQQHEIGEVAYDRLAYERQAGLQDISYPAAVEPLLSDGHLSLVQSDSGAVVLDEVEKTVESDDRCVYLQKAESVVISIRLHDRGQAPANPQLVRLRQYVTSNRAFVPATAANAIVGIPDEVEVPVSGVRQVSIQGLRAGTCLIAFLPPGENVASLQFFANLRVLPVDDYDAVPDAQITFPLVYQEVLRYYYFLYPAMNSHVDLSNEEKVTLRAQFVRDRISKNVWVLSKYMPILRDLSDGKRKLLTRWCNLVLGD